jgi:NADPH-dependent 2,4-dienoyl-CoA reductase/sulfur reductase-like enzyme/rhodanese-related sulfurtransferase
MTTSRMSSPLRVLVIGGVAGGATAAARARRVDEQADITVIERGPYISFANCGLPYYIAGEIADRSQLLLETPESLARRYRIRALVDTDAIAIDRAGKRVHVRGPEGDRWLSYDRLILAQGGSPIRPALPGSDASHVFTLWTVPDTDRLQAFIAERKPETAVVVGGGFIGLEMAESFTARGLRTTIVELQPTLMAQMDGEFGAQIAHACEEHGVTVLTGLGVTAVHADDATVELTDGRRIAADLVLFSIGVRPDVALAKSAGLAMGSSGALLVNEQLQTSDDAIFAAGDMIEVEHRISGRHVRMPLAGPANRQGRIAASNALGQRMPYAGVIGTSVVKVFHNTAGMTGLTERAARDAGFSVGVAIVHAGSHAKYYPGAHELSLKIVYDKSDARLLGAQAFGVNGVDKRIDALAMALQGRLSVHDLAAVDLGYAPPYSSANDPINVVAFVAENDLSGYSVLMTATQLQEALASPTPPLVLDVRRDDEFVEGHLRGALHIPIDELRESLDRLPHDRSIAVLCYAGARAHLAVRILHGAGMTDVRNVTGGWRSVQLTAAPFAVETSAKIRASPTESHS